MTKRSLEDVLQAADNPVEMLRNSPIGAYVYPIVAPEFSNWRDEQRAWRESAVLYDQSHHMAELMVEGPGAFDLLSGLAINSFADFTTAKAKHFVPCNYDGYVIGDVILFRLTNERFNMVGREPTVNWVQFHCETGGYDVSYTRDDRSPARAGDKPIVRLHYRYQIQGPRARAVIEKLIGGSLPSIKFFNVGTVRFAGREIPALHHGMAGEPGLEIWGPYAEGAEVKQAILEAGEEYGIRQVGSRAYATNTLESGWIPSPLPAVYTGERMKSYREWLPADHYEAVGSLGGSFVSYDIEDYYLTPHALGYGFYVKFDHDFIGRDALEEMSDGPHRKKVTFEWNPDDVVRVWRSLFEPDGENLKHIDLPLSNYTSASYDVVLREGTPVGFSMFSGYTFNERAFLSLGTVDPDVQIGDELTLVWGEEGGGTRKTTVERHRQTEIQVRIAPTPYSSDAREGYGGRWRGATT
ncbi:MAG TPA: aminomethyl transferase family protein [Acidimicrobiia bacterium]|nr:aminomethyl transferase family protein [Acidimicrobiia bacterium]